eukprot:TRINITY_DN10297_c0_g1_i1.p1 TRINITY_DN10297_c0_g1~~TRINITY_DN10297_c0_g1_i1.p1  ORF type:complete len:1012 (-),score=266.53 TRINITY_DN10297_c0_g1_i1:14-2650(-)
MSALVHAREIYRDNVSVMISKEKAKILFFKLEEIEEVNKQFLEKLHERLGDSFDGLTDDIVISDLLIDLADECDVYGEYAANHNLTIKLLVSLENDKEVNKFLETAPSEYGVLDLGSLLIQPIQRIPRYRMLLEEIIESSPKHHRDYQGLNIALEKTKVVADAVNEEVRSFENLQKLAEIRKVFGKVKEVKDLITEDRVFIYEGILSKVCRRKNKRFYFVLFNDKLIYGVVSKNEETNPKFVDFNRAIDLQNSHCEDLDDTEDQQNAFQILSPTKSFVVIADSNYIKSQWVTRFQECEMNREGSILAPVWAQDGKNCMHCNTAFTTLKRRHHCRNCGDLVCDKCSPKSAIVYQVSRTKPKRICTKRCGYLLELKDTDIEVSISVVGDFNVGKTALFFSILFGAKLTTVTPALVENLTEESCSVQIENKYNSLKINLKLGYISKGLFLEQNPPEELVKDKDGYIVVFSFDDEFTFWNIPKWCEFVRTEGNHTSPIAVLGNKMDAEKKLESSEAKAQADAEKSKYYETSIFEPETVDTAVISHALDVVYSKYGDNFFLGVSDDWSVSKKKVKGMEGTIQEHSLAEPEKLSKKSSKRMTRIPGLGSKKKKDSKKFVIKDKETESVHDTANDSAESSVTESESLNENEPKSKQESNSSETIEEIDNSKGGFKVVSPSNNIRSSSWISTSINTGRRKNKRTMLLSRGTVDNILKNGGEIENDEEKNEETNSPENDPQEEELEANEDDSNTQLETNNQANKFLKKDPSRISSVPHFFKKKQDTERDIIEKDVKLVKSREVAPLDPESYQSMLKMYNVSARKKVNEEIMNDFLAYCIDNEVEKDEILNISDEDVVGFIKDVTNANMIQVNRLKFVLMLFISENKG